VIKKETAKRRVGVVSEAHRKAYKAVKELLKEKPDLSHSAAARELGIAPQLFHNANKRIKELARKKRTGSARRAKARVVGSGQPQLDGIIRAFIQSLSRDAKLELVKEVIGGL